LTVDVEEWYQTVLFRPRDTDPGVRTDLPESVRKILSLLDELRVRATFFVLGSVAEKYPGLVELVASRGHEIASHGYSHRLVSSLSPREFAEELRRSREVLARAAGTDIAGYRASTWSLSDDSGWAVAALAQAGFRYDSSIYPVRWRPRFGGDLDERRFPRRLDCGLWEFPPSTFRLLGWNMPFAGGTFLRFQTLESIKRRMLRIRALGRPAMLYCHSWEFSDSLPDGIPAWKRFVQFGNVLSVGAKIAALAKLFAMGPIRDILFAPRRAPGGAGNEDSILEPSA